MNDQQKSEKLNCDDQQNSETYFFWTIKSDQYLLINMLNLDKITGERVYNVSLFFSGTNEMQQFESSNIYRWT